MKHLLTRIRKFNQERDWERFHSPKNLAMALMIEASEIAEHFQWVTEEESRDLPPETLAHITDEVGDVLIHLLNLADKLGIDLARAAEDKMDKNENKYPATLVRGRADKYMKYQPGSSRPRESVSVVLSRLHRQTTRAPMCSTPREANGVGMQGTDQPATFWQHGVTRIQTDGWEGPWFGTL